MQHIRFSACYVIVVILQRWVKMVAKIACAPCTLHGDIPLLECSDTGYILTEI